MAHREIYILSYRRTDEEETTEHEEAFETREQAEQALEARRAEYLGHWSTNVYADRWFVDTLPLTVTGKIGVGLE